MPTTEDSRGAALEPHAPPPVSRVVVPIDGSPASTRALPLAVQLAHDLEVSLSIVSVIRNFRTEGPDRVATLQQVLSDLPDSIDRKVVQSDAIHRAIAEESVDGIVCMSTSGRVFDDEGIPRSVAEFVTAVATSPVIVVGPLCPETPTIDRIIIGIDPSHDQRGLSYWSTRVGYQLGLPVEFVHVDVDGPTQLGPKVRRLELGPSESVAKRLVAEAAGALLAIGSHSHIGIQRLMEGKVGAALFADATQPLMILGPQIAV